MGWHTRAIDEYTCRTCGKKATVWLYNDVNAPSGTYCAMHGEAEAKKKNEATIAEWDKG